MALIQVNAGIPLPEIMLLVVSATIAGCDDLVEVCEWGRERLDFLRRHLLYRDDIPSHDTKVAPVD